MLIASQRYDKNVLCKQRKLDWNETSSKILGITFTHNLGEMVERNYKDKLKALKRQMNTWLARDLTLLGRNTVL